MIPSLLEFCLKFTGKSPGTIMDSGPPSTCTVLDIQLSELSGNPILQSGTETDRMSASIQEGTQLSDSGVPSPSSGNPLSELASVLTPHPLKRHQTTIFSKYLLRRTLFLLALFSVCLNRN